MLEPNKKYTILPVKRVSRLHLDSLVNRVDVGMNEERQVLEPAIVDCSPPVMV